MLTIDGRHGEACPDSRAIWKPTDPGLLIRPAGHWVQLASVEKTATGFTFRNAGGYLGHECLTRWNTIALHTERAKRGPIELTVHQQLASTCVECPQQAVPWRTRPALSRRP